MNKAIRILFENHFGEKVAQAVPLKAHGSNRRLLRITSKHHNVISAENEDHSENVAFVEFSRYFRQMGLPVPEIYAENLAENIYLEEDLGDDTLFDLMTAERKNQQGFPKGIELYYEKVVRTLPRFQIEAARTFNYELCYPRHTFDRQSMMWDLNYFKYYFLKLAQIPFDEQKLEDDFNAFTDFLLETDTDYFLYRDFQSRNIMIRDGEPYFIDYQGGRRGALQYDIASLLYDAKADLPFDVRDRLMETYLDALQDYIPVDRDAFLKYYYGYVLVRLMQAMGAYGFRGFYERKAHFLQSVPYAIRNLEYILKNADLPLRLPTLLDVGHRLVQSTRLRELGNVHLPLTVLIESFSFKKGLPKDETGHGGGFVFDCRLLPNPGRLERFKFSTGNDDDVIQFMAGKHEVHSFLTRVRDMISQVVEDYQKRNFTHLTVAFGCTGGQHRSVYCANVLSAFLKGKYDVNVEVMHHEEGNWPTE